MRKRANGFDVGKRKLMFRGVESRSRRRSIRLLRVVVHAPHLFPEFGRQHPDRSFESRGKCFRRCEPQLVGERLYLYVVIGFREDVAGFVDAARVDVLRKRHSAVLVDRSRQIGAVRFESVGDLIDGDIGSPIDFFPFASVSRIPKTALAPFRPKARRRYISCLPPIGCTAP